jgi:hypothetical protein
MPAMFGGIFSAVFIPLAAQRQQRMKKIRHAMLKHQHCPHCGYNLRDLPLAPSDGATICPECACAWHLDEVHGADPVTGETPAERSRRMQLKMTLLIIGLAAFFALGIVFFIARL